MSIPMIHTGERPVRGRRRFTLGVLLPALLASMACTPQPPSGTPTEPSPPTTVPSTTTSNAASEFQSTASLFGDLPPGRYRTEGFEPVNFSFEVREPTEGEIGWGGGLPPEEVAEAFGGDPQEVTGETRWAIAAEAAPRLPVFEFIRRWDFERMRTGWGISFLKESFSASIEDVLAELSGVEGLELQGDPTATQVGGATGLYVEGVVGSQGASPFAGISYPPGKKIRFYVLGVGGVTKVVALKAPVEDFETFLPEGEELLSTVHFGN